MRRTMVLSLALTATLALSSALAAQSAQRFSLQGSFLYEDVMGDDWEGINSGIGFEGQVRFTPSAWSFGAGVQYTSHDVDDIESDETIGEIKLLGFFFEPRYVIATGSNSFAPYISGRFALTSLDMSVEGVGDVGDANGYTANFGGGVLVRLGGRANLDLGATFGLTNWGNLDVGDFGEFDLGTGSNLIARVGLAIGLGG